MMTLPRIIQSSWEVFLAINGCSLKAEGKILSDSDKVSNRGWKSGNALVYKIWKGYRIKYE